MTLVYYLHANQLFWRHVMDKKSIMSGHPVCKCAQFANAEALT